MTTRGPAVGEAEVSSRQEAVDRLESAVLEAFAPASTEHLFGVRTIAVDLLCGELPVSYRTTAIAVTLDA